MHRRTALSVLGWAAVLTACGRDKSKASPSQGATAGTASSNETSFTIEAGDDMKFSRTELKCKAGSAITVTLKHTGKMAKNTMGHNFVILAPGADPNAVANAAIDAAPDYIPKGDKRILAHTKLLGGGQSDTVSFTAPTAGTYPFICTFPGHVAMMKGKLVAS